MKEGEDEKGCSLWRICQPDGTVFPRPLNLKVMTQEQLDEVMNLFRLTGTFIAKSILDDKLIDLPISRLMWDLLFGKVSKFPLHSLSFFCPETEFIRLERT